jgi:hypothetical protein
MATYQIRFFIRHLNLLGRHGGMEYEFGVCGTNLLRCATAPHLTRLMTTISYYQYIGHGSNGPAMGFVASQHQTCMMHWAQGCS